MPGYISEKSLKPVRQFITSGAADEQVPDRSVFREQFLLGIEGEADRNGDGYVTGAELGEFLDEKVASYSQNCQHPQIGKIRDPRLDKGDFVFARVPSGGFTMGSPASEKDRGSDEVQHEVKLSAFSMGTIACRWKT